MNYWNYRLMRKVYPSGEVEYSIHEVHYCDGEVCGWTENPASLVSCDEDGTDVVTNMKKIFEMMQTALDKPILNFETGDEV